MLEEGIEDDDAELQAALRASLEEARANERAASVGGPSGASGSSSTAGTSGAATGESSASRGGGSGATNPGVVLERGHFVAGACSILKLAVDGSDGLLHSARALRDMSLQRTGGDQDVAGRQARCACLVRAHALAHAYSACLAHAV